MRAATRVGQERDLLVAPPTGVADRLGDGARCLLLLAPAADDPEAASLALGLAQRLGDRRPRTLLVNLEREGRRLDRALGLEDAAGLTAAFRGDARMADVAVRGEGQSFFYFPAGAAAAPARALLSSRALGHLVERARAGGGSVLLYATPGDLPPGGGRPAVDGCLLLGSARRDRAPVRTPVMGRLIRPVPSRASSERAGRRSSWTGRPGREESVPPWDDTGRSLVAPVASGMATLASEIPLVRRVRSRWRQIVLLCGLALVVGFLIAWVGAHDLWEGWMNWSSAVKGRAG